MVRRIRLLLAAWFLLAGSSFAYETVYWLGTSSEHYLIPAGASFRILVYADDSGTPVQDTTYTPTPYLTGAIWHTPDPDGILYRWYVEATSGLPADNYTDYEVDGLITFVMHKGTSTGTTDDPSGVLTPPEPDVLDQWNWNYQLIDGIPDDGMDYTCSCSILMEDDSVLQSGGGAAPYSFTGFYECETDGVGLQVTSVQVDVFLEGELVNSHAFGFFEDGNTASGGINYSMNFVDNWDNNPELPPVPLDPTEPPAPLDPTDPNPPVAGGDTSPEVASNYEAFRDAVESALDNRNISQEELQQAYETALNNQGLDAENLKDAMSNALKENAQTQTGQRDSVQNALSRQGLSGSNIGKQVADALDGKLGEGPAGTYSSDITFGETADFDASAAQSKATIEGMDWGGALSGFADRFKAALQRIFTISFPELGQSQTITFEMPSYMGVDIPALHIDLGDLQYVYLLRHLQVFALVIWGIRQCMHIFNATFQ